MRRITTDVMIRQMRDIAEWRRSNGRLTMTQTTSSTFIAHTYTPGTPSTLHTYTPSTRSTPSRSAKVVPLNIGKSDLRRDISALSHVLPT